MEIVKILGIALIGTFLALVLKEQKAVFGIAVGILTAVAVFLFFAPTLLEIISYVRDLSSALDGEDAYIRTILKITGVACLTKIGSDVVKDAGFTAVSSAVSMAGRILCILFCLPSVAALFRLLTAILPG